MDTLTRQELHKITCRRSVKIAVTGLLLLFAILPMFGKQSLRWYINLEEYISGDTALQKEKEGYRDVEGILDEAKLGSLMDEIHQKITGKTTGSMEQDAALMLNDHMMKYQGLIRMIGEPLSDGSPYGEIRAFETLTSQDASSVYSNWRSYVEQRMQGNSDKEVLHTYLSDSIRPFTYQYSRGWSFAIEKYIDIILGICIVLTICLSTCFAYERKSGADALLLSSRYGRKQVVKSKSKAALFFACSLYIVSLLVFYISTFLQFGIDGAFASIQSNWIFAPLQMTMFTANGILFLMGLCAVCFMSMLLLALSQLTKSTFKVQAVIIISIYLIYTVLEMSTTPWIQTLCSLFPIGFVKSEFITMFPFRELFGITFYEPIAYGIYAILGSVLLFFVIKVSVQHQEVH